MSDHFEINRKSGLSVGKQIASYFRDKIVNNELKPGDKLPATQQLVQQFGVGTHSVREGMSRLEKEGLLESSPRRGTFVKGVDLEGVNGVAQSQANDSVIKQDTFRRIAVLSSIGDGPGEFGTYRAETMAGLLKEGERLNSVIQVFPRKLKHAPLEQIHSTLKASGIDGVVWPSPSKDDWKIIEYLQRYKMPVVASRRSRCNDGRACVESDYESVGFEAGEFLVAQGCKQLLFLAHYPTKDYSSTDIADGHRPMGLQDGLHKAFTASGFTGDDVFCRETHDGYSAQVSNAYIEAINNSDPQCGIVFTNGYQFLEFMKNCSDAASVLLQTRRFVIVSNYSITVRLASYMNNLNPLILEDPFEDVAKFALQKLVGMIEGIFENTTVLVDIKSKRFNDVFNKDIK